MSRLLLSLSTIAVTLPAYAQNPVVHLACFDGDNVSTASHVSVTLDSDSLRMKISVDSPFTIEGFAIKTTDGKSENYLLGNYYLKNSDARGWEIFGPRNGICEVRQ